jgi:hypothetical protein
MRSKLALIFFLTTMLTSCSVVYLVTGDMETRLKGYEGKTATLKRFVPLQLTENGIMVHNLPEVCNATLIKQGDCEELTATQEEDDIPAGTEILVVKTYVVGPAMTIFCSTVEDEPRQFSISLYSPEFFSEKGFPNLSMEQQLDLVLEWQ